MAAKAAGYVAYIAIYGLNLEYTTCLFGLQAAHRRPRQGGHLRDAAPPPPQMPRKNHGKEVVFRDLLLELML